MFWTPLEKTKFKLIKLNNLTHRKLSIDKTKKYDIDELEDNRGCYT